MFQPNHFVPLSNSRQGTKRKDDDESEIGWTKVSPKKSRKQATLKSFLLPKNKTKASSDETQQSSFQPSQKSYPSQPQRQDNKATSTSPGKNGSTTTREDNHATTASPSKNGFTRKDEETTSAFPGKNGSTMQGNKASSASPSKNNTQESQKPNSSMFTSSNKSTSMPNASNRNAGQNNSMSEPNNTQKWDTPAMGDVPHQPVKKFPATAYGTKKRPFQFSWFKKWTWLHYDEVRDGAFCFVCIKALKEYKLTNASVEKAFISPGFRNWKKATIKFTGHERSKCHLEAMQRLYVVPKTTRDVGESLSTLHAEQKCENRLCFVTILSNLQFLARQGLALRGDGNKKNSNFHQLLALRSRESSLLKAWVENRTEKYTSPDIQNSVIGIMANRILRNLVSTIHSSPFYSIMADESDESDEQRTTCNLFAMGGQQFQCS